MPTFYFGGKGTENIVVFHHLVSIKENLNHPVCHKEEEGHYIQINLAQGKAFALPFVISLETEENITELGPPWRALNFTGVQRGGATCPRYRPRKIPLDGRDGFVWLYTHLVRVWALPLGIGPRATVSAVGCDMEKGCETLAKGELRFVPDIGYGVV